jgi:CheY-like chemotaxis protein
MKKTKLVIIENDEDERIFMKEGFEETGFFEIVALFQNGDELIRFLEKENENIPDLILSDLNMPGKNGFDILESRNNIPFLASIPIVITSTSSSRFAIEKCLGMGALHYMVKPDTFDKYGPFAKKLHDFLNKNGLPS